MRKGRPAASRYYGSRPQTPSSKKNFTPKLPNPAVNASGYAKISFHKQKEADLARKRREDEETARVYADFVASFEQDNSSISQSWVRGGTGNCENTHNTGLDRDDTLYQPSKRRSSLPKLDSLAPPQSPTDADRHKKKRTLDTFLELIKNEQHERDTIRKRKHWKTVKDGFKAADESPKHTSGDPGEESANRDTADHKLTVLHVKNINDSVDENALHNELSKFGPIRTVRVVKPQFSSEHQYHEDPYGIVEFMEARDAEVAMKLYSGTDLLGRNIQPEWGDLQLSSCSPREEEDKKFLNASSSAGHCSKKNPEHEITVLIPKDIMSRVIIHRMVERTVVFGPAFENVIMERERGNPKFKFLFDNSLEDHIYYRWKLYSIMQGDDARIWNESPFQMYLESCTWIPPQVREKTDTGCDDNSDDGYRYHHSQPNSPEYLRHVLRKCEYMLTKLDMSKTAIGEVMVYAINHSEYAEDIVDLISRSLSLTSTPVIPLKISRLFLVSDILYNSSTNVPNCWRYRMYLEKKLPDIFKHLGYVRKNLQKRLKQEQMRVAVLGVITAWEGWIIFPTNYIQNLVKLFTEFDKTSKHNNNTPLQPDNSSTLDTLHSGQKDSATIHFRPVPEELDEEPAQHSQSLNKHDSPEQQASARHLSSYSNYSELSDEDISGLTTPEE